MKGFIDTLKNIWSIEDLRKKIIYTFLLILVYRIGSFIVLPGIDPNGLTQLKSNASTGLLGLLNMFVGGSFANASIFALGVMPYISASIFVQLLTMAVPYFQRLSKEGDSGRKKITQLTRVLTIGITLFQAIGYVTYLQSTSGDAIIAGNAVLFWFTTVFVLTAGTLFCMWLGERITDRGLGNGISILIMTGILARLPFALGAEFVQRTTQDAGGGLIFFLLELVLMLAVVLLVILLVQGTRRIELTYAKAQVGAQKTAGARRSFLPLKVNTAGVMPIIFAQALMFIPSVFAQFMSDDSALKQSITSADYTFSLWYNVLFFLLIVAFTYFYTALVVNPNQIAEDLKRSDGFIAGIKPGPNTADYIDAIVSRITLPGAVLLGIIAILPVFANFFNVNPGFAQFYGGTSIIIAVSVILDTLQQIESHLLMRHYDGLLEGGTRIQGRNEIQSA